MKVIIALIIWLFCMETNGQIVTDRPDQTESSSVVPSGSLQLESGVLVGYEEENQEIIRQILLPTNLFRFGLTNGIEVRISNQFEMLRSGESEAEGISDLEVGTKVQITKGEIKDTEIAFLAHLIMVVA